MDSFSHEELATLSTLAYYQALGVPSLTAMELLRYWTPWNDNSSGSAAHTPSLHEIIRLTDMLKERGVLQKKNGYVALLGNKHFFEGRIQAKKEGVKKRQTYLRFARFLPYVPFVRMVALTGSLATDSTNEQSDIDVLVGGNRGRIWTTRLLVTALFQLLGRRRHGTKITNRICLNHYVALGQPPDASFRQGAQGAPRYNSNKNFLAAFNQKTDAIVSPRAPFGADEAASFRLVPKALTTAHIYAQALPLWGAEAFGRIRESNAWLASFVGQALAPALPRTLCTPNPLGMGIKYATEKALFPLWELTEQVGGALQKKHIHMRLAGKRVDPLEILVEDDTLLFHYPFSRSKHALARYQEYMRSFAP